MHGPLEANPSDEPRGGRRHPLRLDAPPGSVAQHVLGLVGLPHTTSDPDADPAGDLPKCLAR
ncbi:hypothetical protein GCM10023107_89210 [Actinoplanes octamycinicus]|nr:hypothetical protein Aoc01nite_64620 [Actinoplanes octamycinicus]